MRGVLQSARTQLIQVTPVECALQCGKLFVALGHGALQRVNSTGLCVNLVLEPIQA